MEKPFPIEFDQYPTTPRYSYVTRGRSPLWNNYVNISPVPKQETKAQEQRRLEHLATPLFNQSRLQKNVNNSGGPKADVPKCLNCGLRGHTILKCDKISRFNELNCRDGLNGGEEMFLVRKHSTGRKTSSNPIISGYRADFSSTVNQLKLPKCRSCGLKGHFTSQCPRDSSPCFQDCRYYSPIRSGPSYFDSPQLLKRRSDLFTSSLDTKLFSKPSDNLATLDEVSDDSQNPSTSAEDKPEDQSLPTTSSSLPLRFKDNTPKRVRINTLALPLTPVASGTELRKRQQVNLIEQDTDSGLDFCSSSDVDATPNDIFDLLDSSIRDFEDEISDGLQEFLEQNGETSDHCNSSGGDNSKHASFQTNQDKKMFKLKLKLIKSWFKKSVQK